MANTSRDVINQSMGLSQDPNFDDIQSAMGGSQPGGPIVITPISISGTPPATGQVGQAYRFAPVTSNGNGTRTYSLAGGTLLSGLMLSTATGAITGIPTADGVISGLSVRVADSTGNASTTPTTVTIAAASDTPNPGDGATLSGLMLRDTNDFSGWTGRSAWSVVSRPALIASERSPIPAQTPMAGGEDAGGNREAFHYEADDGAWYMFYGAGNGRDDGDPGGPWSPQYSKSTDKGLTWSKLGRMSMRRKKGDATGDWAACDMLFFEKRDGLYLLHRLTAATVTFNQVCGQPYTSDVWSSPTIEGTYTFVRRTLLSGDAGTFDGRDAYASCMVLKDGVYYMFYSATSEGSEYQIGLSTGLSPTGPFTKQTSAVLPDAIKLQPENPEVFWIAAIGKWAMLANQVNKVEARTDRNRVYFSESLTDWSSASWHETQMIVPSDGVGVIGLPRTTRRSDNLPIFDQLGNVPVVHDADPATDAYASHTRRSLFYSQHAPGGRGYRPSFNIGAATIEDFAAYTTGALGGQGSWVDASGNAALPQIVRDPSGVKVLDMRQSLGASMVYNTALTTKANSTRYLVAMVLGGQSGLGFGFGYKPGVAHLRVDIAPNEAGFTFSTLFVGADGSETQIDNQNVQTGLIATGGRDTNFSIELVNGVVAAKVDDADAPAYTYAIPATYNAQLAQNGFAQIRNGFAGSSLRTVKSLAVIDPATVATTAPKPMRAVPHSSFAAAFDAMPVVASSSAIDFYYRSQSATAVDNAYKLTLDLSGAGPVAKSVQKIVAGTATEIAASQSTRRALSRLFHRIRVVVTGSTHKVFVNGEMQLSFTDATYANGVAIGLGGPRLGTDVDLRDIRMMSADYVTINGLTAGDKVTLRGAGGIPYATATATSGQLALASPVYPLSSVTVNGDRRYEPVTGVWGGDVYGGGAIAPAPQA